MNEKKYTLPTALVGVMFAFCMAFVLVRTFLPNFIIPGLDVPNMVLISLIALLADFYLAPGARRCYVCVAVSGVLSFGLLPFAACIVGAQEALKLGITGGVVFTGTTWLFSSIADRISTGPGAKAAPFMSAFGLYLAAQVLMGMF